MESIHKDVCWFVIFVIFIAITQGCTLTDKSKHKKNRAPENLGVITTGGALARPHTLPIPVSGLSLGEAVEISLRPVVRQLAIQPVPAGPALQAVGSQSISRLDQLRSTFARVFSKLGDDSKEIPFAHFMDIDEVKFGLTVEEQDILKSQIIRIVEQGRENKSFKSLDSAAPVFEELRIALRIEASPQSRLGAPSSGYSTGMYYRSVVVLTRRVGTRIIAPLWLVQMFPIGDVALVDGDSVRIESYKRTEVGARQLDEQSGTVIIAGITRDPRNVSLPTSLETLSLKEATNLNAAVADVILLRHVNQQGHLEQYVIPRLRSGAFGEDPEFSRFLAETRLASGDIVEFQNLDLLPEIRRGRITAITSTANAIERNRRESVLAERIEDRRDHLQQFTGVTPATFQRFGERTRDALTIIPSSIGF
ncbi:hypothetical protein [uncultured Rubinisphaera sp.]|uniref:hypothetical protein n=1 Tax=uncultured Rubinisphaera sp. TaxID=1678686 RepID=UPI0030D7C760